MEALLIDSHSMVLIDFLSIEQLFPWLQYTTMAHSHYVQWNLFFISIFIKGNIFSIHRYLNFSYRYPFRISDLNTPFFRHKNIQVSQLTIFPVALFLLNCVYGARGGTCPLLRLVGEWRCIFIFTDLLRNQRILVVRFVLYI